MNMNKIKDIARNMNLDPGSMNKKDLIRLVQEKEGNTPCFKTDVQSCDQFDCCWRNDCQPGGIITLS